jgi:hypothetical protein
MAGRCPSDSRKRGQLVIVNGTFRMQASRLKLESIQQLTSRSASLQLLCVQLASVEVVHRLEACAGLPGNGPVS